MAKPNFVGRSSVLSASASSSSAASACVSSPLFQNGVTGRLKTSIAPAELKSYVPGRWHISHLLRTPG